MKDPIMYGTGWDPEPPSDRDYTERHPRVAPLFQRRKLHRAVPEHLPVSVDLREWCSPVQFQGYYNTCQAHVVAGMLEFLENRAFGKYVPASRLFLYQVTRRMLKESGDPGIHIRRMLGALAVLGVPPEKYWPYLERENDPRLDQEPDAFPYALARSWGALHYYRLDPESRPRSEVLHQIRTHMAAHQPTTLGFPLYKGSLVQAVETGKIPYANADELVGTHAVLLVGYDDRLKIRNTDAAERGLETTGAFLIKNSWSDRWGEQGYGWLPYDYLLQGHARDCWTMTDPKWIDTGRFDLDVRDAAAADGRTGRGKRTAEIDAGELQEGGG